jgi:hypothetical protein
VTTGSPWIFGEPLTERFEPGDDDWTPYTPENLDDWKPWYVEEQKPKQKRRRSTAGRRHSSLVIPSGSQVVLAMHPSDVVFLALRILRAEVTHSAETPV